MTIIIETLFAMGVSFLITFFLVPILYALAVRLQVVDVPDGKIKCHARTTPYLGGVAVYAGFMTIFALIAPWNYQSLLFALGLTLLLLVGLIDDLLVMKPYQKFLGQILAVFCFLKGGFFAQEEFIDLHWRIILSFFWMLSIINAFNLVDVMDGLSTTLASCATISFIGIAWYFNQIHLVVVLSAFLGSLGAFFWYNRPLAKMYLGDAGSLYIGGFLATIPFLMPWTRYSPYGFLAPMVILAIPSLEIVTLIIIRSYKGIPFYLGSPDHFCLYLKKKGWSVWRVLGFSTALSGVLFLSAFLLVSNVISLAGLGFLALVFLVAWFKKIFF